MDKETSSRVSSLAGTYFGMDHETFAKRYAADPVAVFDEIQSISASATTQDQTPGQSGGIHPAPVEFSEAQLTLDPVLHYFHYAHLPPHLAATSVKFFYLALFIVHNLPRNAERTVALRKLLEAKDAAVRANLPAPKLGEKPRVASSHKLGEPVETGGHDEDRDGPIPFGD